jgi:hypothetical protein
MSSLEGKGNSVNGLMSVGWVLTNLKGVSTMRLHRDLGISQPSAWFLAHRIRKAMDNGDPVCSGPV